MGIRERELFVRISPVEVTGRTLGVWSFTRPPVLRSL